MTTKFNWTKAVRAWMDYFCNDIMVVSEIEIILLGEKKGGD